MEKQIIIKIDHLYKKYRLGAIGGGTLRADLQSWWANKTGKEDPNIVIGTEEKNRKGEFWALKGINAEIYKGERIGIIGGNGAGKSTMLKVLSRVTAPTEGEIKIKGRIASMLEVGTGFHPELTGRENIYLNGAILGMSKAEVTEKIEDIIEFSECRKFIDTPVKRYSSGMYVKLAFAVAAHLDSEILIMDEVLAVGDMKFQQKCLDKMRSLAEEEERTILYVSHNMNTIAQLCNRCIVLKQGKIIFDGNVEDGIKKYLNSDVDTDVLKVYHDFDRPRWITTRKVRVLRAEFFDKTTNILCDDEKAVLKIMLQKYEKIENISVRWEIRTYDNIPVGSSRCENIFWKDEKTLCLKLEYDLSELVEGSYTSCMTVYQKDDSGNFIELDWVPGLNFEKRLIKDKDIIWNAKQWGYIELPKAEMTVV